MRLARGAEERAMEFTCTPWNVTSHSGDHRPALGDHRVPGIRLGARLNRRQFCFIVLEWCVPQGRSHDISVYVCNSCSSSWLPHCTIWTRQMPVPVPSNTAGLAKLLKRLSGPILKSTGTVKISVRSDAFWQFSPLKRRACDGILRVKTLHAGQISSRLPDGAHYPSDRITSPLNSRVQCLGTPWRSGHCSGVNEPVEEAGGPGGSGTATWTSLGPEKKKFFALFFFAWEYSA
ncbi:hypothetical protein C8R45DRAFT_433702 [Mycena sanguinolenta]|nr:hypothetical protein C8R45DRAFT_433702 [Mycena sanguinolenta]